MRVPRKESMESSNRTLSIDGTGRAVPHEDEGKIPCRTCSFQHRATPGAPPSHSMREPRQPSIDGKFPPPM